MDYIRKPQLPTQDFLSFRMSKGLLTGPCFGPGFYNPKALRLKIAPKPHIIWSLGPKTLKHESLEP